MTNAGPLGKQNSPSLEIEMQYFDNLPPRLRKALKEANFKYSAFVFQKALFALKAKAKSTTEAIDILIELIKKGDELNAEKYKKLMKEQNFLENLKRNFLKGEIK